MMMSGSAKTYQVIHEVIPHEGDSQVKMVNLMNKAVVKLADTIILRNKTYIQDMIERYGINAERVKYLELWRRYPGYTSPVHKGRALFSEESIRIKVQTIFWKLFACVLIFSLM